MEGTLNVFQHAVPKSMYMCFAKLGKILFSKQNTTIIADN